MTRTPFTRILSIACGAGLIGLACVSTRAEPAATDEQGAQQIVARADEIRLPKSGFQSKVTITTQLQDKSSEVREYQILSKGNENALVMTLSPPVDRGQIMLMKGRDLWLFLPNVSQPVRLPLSQRLTGQVANGDLARANFTGDYNARLLGLEKISNQDFYKLELNANDRAVTYHRILYWVYKSTNWPYQAEFYAVSGRLLKTAYYTKYQKISGVVRPTRLIMRDSLAGGEQSILDYSEINPRDLPDKIFTKEYLKKLVSN